MANIRDLYYSQDSETVGKIPDAPTKTIPDSSFTYAAKKALDSPSRSGAWLRDKLDRIQGATEYSPEELHKMYPEADPGLYKSANTKRFAEYILERDRANKTLDMLKEYRSRDSVIPNIARDIGYGALQNIGPVDIAAGAAIGAGVAVAAPAVGIGAIVGGAMTASIPEWAAIGAISGGLEGTFGYLLDKQLERRTQEKADPMQIPIGTAFGGLAGGLGGLWKNRYMRGGSGVKSSFDTAADDFLKGNGTIDIPEDKITRIPKGTHSSTWEANVQLEGPTEIKAISGGMSKLIDGNYTPTGDVTLAGKLKYKSYSAAEYYPHDAKPNVRYAIINDESIMTHYGAEDPFAGATYLAETTGDLKGYAATVGQGGRLAEIQTGNLKIADLGKVETISMIQDLLSHYTELLDGPLPEHLDGQTLMRFIAKQETADIIQHDLMESLKSQGYDALSYNTTESLLGRRFKKNHTFLFDGPSGHETKTIDILNGSLGGLPESVALNNEIVQKAYDLRNSQGIISNGKKISLDPFGYFDTDPYYGNEQTRVGYIEYFDKDHIDFINDMIETNDIERLNTMVPQLQADTIEYLQNLEVYKEFLDESGIEKAAPIVEKMAKEDPKLYQEVAKATDFCLRRFRK